MDKTYSGLLNGYAYGTGYQQPKNIGDLAAGATYTLTAPGDRVYRLIAGIYTFTTSAVVATRHTALFLLDTDSNQYGDYRANSQTAASTTSQYSLSQNVPSTGVGIAHLVPNILLYPGWSWQLTADALDTGDQFTGVRFLIEEFPVGHDGYSVTGVNEHRW